MLLSLGFLCRSFSSKAIPQKVLILSKVTRYEYEKSSLGPRASEESLRSFLASRGSTLYDSMKRHHELHIKYVDDLMKALRSFNIPEVRITNRLDYTNELVDWADMILTAGGDGTFLMGASKVRSNVKPVVGFNTDSSKSEGYLLLPHDLSPRDALQFIFNSKGDCPWAFRKRIRITLNGPEDKIKSPPLEIHQRKVVYPEYRFIEESKEGRERRTQSTSSSSYILPVLALNEVFIGESLSSRVSCLQISIDHKKSSISKNSGFCVSTGSGSTSWTFNINKLTPQAVKRILQIASDQSPSTDLSHLLTDSVISSITSSFNGELLFDPNDSVMSYTLRDPISVGTFPSKNELGPRGFAQEQIHVRSMCFDACLVIDGSLSFKFDDGMSAILEMRDEDALRTVLFKK